MTAAAGVDCKKLLEENLEVRWVGGVMVAHAFITMTVLLFDLLLYIIAMMKYNLLITPSPSVCGVLACLID